MHAKNVGCRQGTPIAGPEGQVIPLGPPVVCVGCNRQCRSTTLTRLGRPVPMAMCWEGGGGVGESLTQSTVCNVHAPNSHFSFIRCYHRPIHDVLEVK
jgi:hypothetical protein